MTWTVEQPGVDDAVEMGRVHVAVWREAYAGLMPADYLAGLDPVAFATSWRERLEAARDGVVQRIARDDAGIVGLATGGPARDEDAPAPWQLYAINVLARGHGSGVADALVAGTVGDRAAYLWVVEGNDRAIAFYGRHGFVLDGVRDLLPETGTPEVRMARDAVTP